MQREPVEPGSPADWIRHAESDLAIASQPPPAGVLFETLCFHAQQAVEKSLKAVLISHNVEPPYTHDIAKLISAIEASGIEWPDRLDDAAGLTRYAVQTRYPGVVGPVPEEHHSRSVAVARAVLAWAERVISKGGT